MACRARPRSTSGQRPRCGGGGRAERVCVRAPSLCHVRAAHRRHPPTAPCTADALPLPPAGDPGWPRHRGGCRAAGHPHAASRSHPRHAPARSLAPGFACALASTGCTPPQRARGSSAAWPCCCTPCVACAHVHAGGPGAPDLNETIQNLAINAAALAILGFIVSKDVSVRAPPATRTACTRAKRAACKAPRKPARGAAHGACHVPAHARSGRRPR